MATNLKRYRNQTVLDAARERISYAFDHFERLYISFSGGKDSTVMMHLVMEEAEKRGRTVGVLIIDLEAQYRATISHVAASVAPSTLTANAELMILLFMARPPHGQRGDQ